MENTQEAIAVRYDLPGIVMVLWKVLDQKQRKLIFIARLIRFVENRLDDVQPNGSVALFCSRSTFDLLLKKVEIYAPDGVTADYSPLRTAVDIKPETFSAIINYCNRIEPGCLIEVKETEPVE